MSLLDQRRFAEARQAISAAIATRDDEPDYYLLRARIEFAAGQTAAAYAAYQDALALDATNAEALQGVSQLGLQVGDYEEAENAADQILTLQPEQSDALLVRGLIALVKRRYEEAGGWADRILRQDEGSEAGAILKARAAFLAGDPQAALAAVNQYEAMRAPTAGSVRTRLEIARARHDAAAMRDAFDQLDRLTPRDATLAIDRGNFSAKTGDKAHARRFLTVALAQKDLTDAQIADAVGVLREYSLLLTPEFLDQLQASANTKSLSALKRLALSRGELNAAKRLQKLMKPQEAQAIEAEIALQQTNLPRAQAIAAEILKQDKDNCAALSVVAAIKLKTGSFSDAVRFGQRASAQCPDLPQAYEITALAYAAQNDPVNARRVFRDGIDTNRQSEPLTRSYVDWLIKQRAVQEAAGAARRLTRAAPASTSGWRLLADVCRRGSMACVGEADRGLAAASKNYGIDLKPGELPPNGLLGRFVVR
ncbi:tetratricopeptide repeat protein [Tsuneonella amylolytica]|uniref:tetratricopeptide repeat protein n=1 Tax=Tsuneonella amylolytica TaxID=2338327 RepID=UPI0013C4EA05|nr:tetratricopeptide repeat protein [Tsuneonella amylolytica]